MTAGPDNTAVRTALWRALHAQIDPAPHILEDTIGLQLAAPDDGWKQRPDMDTNFTRRVRVSIATRARFVEDLVIESGITQYVILGAGLDTFAQRTKTKLQIFEIDRPDTQAWKQKRLREIGFGIPKELHFIPMDFEGYPSWREKLKESGFDMSKPAVISCTGVSMYLTKEAIIATLKQVTRFAPGSVFAMTFLLPIELLEKEDEQLMEISMKGAMRAGNPFKSLFTPQAMLDLAKGAGCKKAKIVSKKELVKKYFSKREDISPASGEEFLIVTA